MKRNLWIISLLSLVLALLFWQSQSRAAPLQQEGCYLLSSESYNGSHWIRDWPTGWPTAHDDRIASGDFSGWHARTIYFNHISNTTVATYDGDFNPQYVLPRHYILILDSSYSDGVGFLRTYNNQFTLELCPPAIPTPTPTATATPDPTITPLAAVDTSDTQIETVLQDMYDGVEDVSMLMTGGIIIALFFIYTMFEFLLIILDRRRRRRAP
jgi:hypothetical protein